MKVYIVTAGTYSDYHIERVFTDESMALAYIEAQKDNDMCIETKASAPLLRGISNSPRRRQSKL